MIEMVYSGKESNGHQTVKVPKNIRQIGDNHSKQKIYIEDYVVNTLKKSVSTEDGVLYGVLLGEVKKSDENTYVFVKAMVKVKEVIENSLIFNDDVWNELYSDIKKYFDGMEIVGWFASLPYRVSDDMNGIKKIHLDNFAGNEKVCFLSDRTENEENFYCFRDGKLKKQQGYYIYYEKNEKMKKYVKNSNNEKSNQPENQVKSDTNNKEKKKIEVTNQKEKTQEPKTFREIIKETTQDTRHQGKIAYGVSGLLIIALLLSTVVMLNNYGELKTIKKTLASFNDTQEARAVGEILDSYDEETTVIETESGTVAAAEEKTEPVETTQKKVEKYVASAYSGQTYTVKKGQTLYDISMKYYGTSKMVDKIKEANNIDDDYTIVEGQKITLP